MPYTDQQIEALQSAAPDAQAGAVGQLSAAERADLAQSISAYKAKKAQPFTGASDVGTAHATPPQMTEEQSLAASRTGGGGMGEFPAGTEAASQQAAKNRAFLPYAWNTPQHVVNSWVDKVIPPTQKMQAQDTDWWDRRNAAEQQSSAPGVASMFNPLTLAGGKGLGPSTLAGRLAGGGVGGAAYRVTQPNASIGNVATAAGLGVAGAGALEAGQSALSTYLNRGAQTQNGAYISPSVGYNPRTVSPTERALKIIAGTDNILLPPEIMNHESVADIMTQAKQDTHLSQDPTISDIQRRSQGTMGRPDVEKAKDTLQRLTVATAEQHGVNLTLGDISGDPQLRLKEQALESKPGSLMNQFRAQQGAQVRDAIIGLGKNADVDTHSQKFAFEQQPKEQGLTEDQMSLTPDQIMMQELAKERKPSLDLAVQDAQRARAAGEIGSNLTEPEILAKKISDMEANPSNPRAIQLSLEGQHWQNRQIDKLNHDEINDTINDTLADNPSLPKTVNVDPVVDKIKDLIRQNKKSPAYSSEVDSNLNSYLTNLTGGEVKDLSYKNVHYAVSAMEKTIADLKEGGNRNLVQNLQQIKNLLDLQKEKFANQVLADQPDELAKVRRASDFHKDHVVPFQDPDHGITQIINGVDPDKAVKTIFTESSPDQFARIFGHLDPKGQAAVRAELIGRTEDSASRMKNFQDINLPGVARYLENRADQVHTAYGEDYTLAALANLIRNTPRAGYQSKLESLFGIHSAAGLAGKSIGALGGAAVGGLPGAAIGTGVEMGAEMAANRAVSSHLINPDMQMYLDQNPIPLDSHFAGRTPPTSGTPPTGPGTGMGPGGRWVGDQQQWRDTLSEAPRYGGDLTRNPTAENTYSSVYTTKGAPPLTSLNPMPNEWGRTRPQYQNSVNSTARTFNLDTSPETIENLSQIQSQRNQARQQLRSTTTDLGASQAEAAARTGTVNRVAEHLHQSLSPVPSYWDLENGIGGYNNRAALAGLAKPQPFSQPEPTMDEMLNAKDQLQRQLGDLKMGGQHNIMGQQIKPAERAVEIQKTETDLIKLNNFIKSGQIDPEVYRNKLNQFNQALAGVMDEATRSGGGEAGNALRQKIEQLTEQREAVKQKLVNASQSFQSALSQAHGQADLGGGWWADQGMPQNGQTSIANVGGGEGLGTIPTRKTRPSWEGGFGHIGQSSREDFIRPSSQVSVTAPHYAEEGYSQTNAPMELGDNVHQIPILGETPTKPGSVGAARHNPFENAAAQIEAANKVKADLEQKAAAAVAAKALAGSAMGPVERPSGPGMMINPHAQKAPVAPSISSDPFQAAQDQLELAKQKYQAAQMDAAQKSKAGPRMAPNPESSSPFQPLPEPPSGKLAQIKAWLRSLTGQNPPLETVAPPAWAPLKEPENVYMPTRSIGEAQSQLESTAQKLSQAKTAAPKPYNGPWTNPIWSAEHRPVGPVELAHNPIPGTGEDPHAYQSDEELVRRLEAENPEMAKLRALKVTDAQKESEEAAITSKAEQNAAANEELRKAGKKVIESPIDTRIDKLAAPKLLDGYQDSINHLQIEHQADVARAKSVGASPDQIRALSVANQTELQVHKDWLTKARALLKAEDYDAYTQHLRRRP